MYPLDVRGRWSRVLIAMLLCSAGHVALARESFGVQSMNGTHIMFFQGSFASAPPPFDGPPVRLDATQVGRFHFDGNGQVWGEYTLTFQTATVPAGVRSRFSVFGTYTVDADGRLLIETDEFVIEPPQRRDDIRDNSVTYECYIVAPQQLARCVQHTLVSYQQGPVPRPLPIAMTGSFERQH